MKNLDRCVGAIMASGKIDHAIISSEFGGRNMGMDEFQAALDAEGLELCHDPTGVWYIYARRPGAAFKHGFCYRPKVWGVGVHACDPRERGVELFAPHREVMDGIEVSNEGAEIILFEYLMTSGRAHARKRAIARRPAPEWAQADEFSTSYRWVENPGVLVVDGGQ